MSEIDQPTISEARALSQLCEAVAAHVRERIVFDYVYDHRHLRRVRKVLRAEGVLVRFGVHERGVWARIVATYSSRRN